MYLNEEKMANVIDKYLFTEKSTIKGDHNNNFHQNLGGKCQGVKNDLMATPFFFYF